MRCPKCGFISFDHLASCAKCGRDISEVASELQGTSIKVEAPMFLSGALAALSESEESFEDHAMEADDGEGIDFDMEMEADEEEAGEHEKNCYGSGDLVHYWNRPLGAEQGFTATTKGCSNICTLAML